MQTLKELRLAPTQIEAFASVREAYLPAEIACAQGLGCGSFLLELDELAGAEAVARRADFFRLPVAPDIYRERILFEDGWRVGIAGIRFRKLRLEFPFVELTLNFYPSADELKTLSRKCLEAFRVFQPKGLLIRQGPDAFAGVPHERWGQILWSRSQDLRRLELPPGYEAVCETSDRIYPEYASEYEAMLAQAPEKRVYLQVETREDIAEAARAGLLFSLRDERGWAGLLAGSEKAFYGVHALYVFEFFLAKRARGRGLAAAFESLFFQALSGRYAMIYGQIQARNAPSLKAAQAVGRKVIETEHFFPFE